MTESVKPLKITKFNVAARSLFDDPLAHSLLRGPMAIIDELLANSAKTDPRMWEAFSNIPKAYYEGREQAYREKMRNVFSDENGVVRLAYVGSLS